MIYLNIGSNLPIEDKGRENNILKAINFLKKLKLSLIKISSFYETPSYPNHKDPKFINMIIGITSNLKPQELAAILISVEESLERKRNYKNEPRTCDIDIIDFEGKTINFKSKTFDFTVPHKELIYRNFVLFPLEEIFPEWKHPITKEPVKTLIEKLSTEDKNSILKINKT